MWVRAIIPLVFLLLPTAAFPQAEKRIALLIGNQSYSAGIGVLKNPHADIVLVGNALRSLDFKVTEIKDADYKSIDTALKRHIQTVRREGEGTISFVYYSGHGAGANDFGKLAKQYWYSLERNDHTLTEEARAPGCWRSVPVCLVPGRIRLKCARALKSPEVGGLIYHGILEE